MNLRSVSIRSSIFWTLVLMLVLISGSLLGVTIWQRARATEKLSHDIIERANDLTERELGQFFKPAEDVLRVSARWAHLGVVDPRRPQALVAAYVPLLRLSPQISALTSGDAAGNGYFLLAERDSWLTREVHRGTWGRRTRLRRLREPDLRLAEEWWEAVDYDPRRRPWYEGAIAAARSAGRRERAALRRDPPTFWTEPYTFFTTKDPGITASRVVEAPGRAPFVIGVDVLLNEISTYTQSLAPSQNGFVFVLDGRGRLLGLPRPSDALGVRLTRNDILRPLDEVPNPLFKEPLAVWRTRGAGRSLATPTFAFQNQGRRLWGGLRPFSLSPDMHLWIGVIVPESDLLGELERQKASIVFIALGTLVIAALISVWLARSYSKPLRALVGVSERIRRLDLGGDDRVVSYLLEVNQLAEAQESMRNALASFARYIPTDVVRELLKRGEAARIGGRLEALTVMFSDITGFTSIAERMPPQDLTQHLADYLQCMLDVLHDHQGTIDKLVGDGVMAFWGAPRPDPRHADHAVLAVLRCQEALRAFHQRCRERGKPELPTRFGLASGEVVVGNIGTQSRLNYTVLGDPVNLASRLVNVNERYGTTALIAEGVREAAGGAIAWRLVDRIVVVGKLGAVNICEPLGLASEVSDRALEFARDYEGALRAYWERDFRRAVQTLERLADRFAADRSVERLLGFSREYLANPPPAQWDGVTWLETK